MEYALIGIIIVILLQIAILKALVEINQEITHKFEEIDKKTAGAIASVIENFGGAGIEPPNMIQQALAEILKSKFSEIADQGSIQATLRNEQGKFIQQD